jgi:hypothetical protein
VSNAVNSVIEQVAGSIDIPDSAYETAQKRYTDLAEWFGRPESRCSPYSPHIYPQGSFRLGTVVRPLSTDGEYDLDVGCRLTRGIGTATHTQKQLKELVGTDLADYRRARRISERLDEMRRCWRLKYADELSFHMDTVPSIPESADRRQVIREAMIRAGTADDLARRVADLTGAITDNQHPRYDAISLDWRVSNSQGYALWFEARMKLASDLLLEQALNAGRSRVDDLPVYRWKSPLQACVQILKRHRDLMFADAPDGAPISVIITTLAGRAYQGETNVGAALGRILSTMGGYISSELPRIPNPVNPAEDFADKWGEPKYRHLNLEAKFWGWLKQAASDFNSIGESRDIGRIIEHARRGFAVPLDPRKIAAALGGSTASLLSPPAAPANLSFPPKPVVPTKPGGFA